MNLFLDNKIDLLGNTPQGKSLDGAVSLYKQYTKYFFFFAFSDSSVQLEVVSINEKEENELLMVLYVKVLKVSILLPPTQCTIQQL